MTVLVHALHHRVALLWKARLSPSDDGPESVVTRKQFLYAGLR